MGLRYYQLLGKLPTKSVALDYSLASQWYYIKWEIIYKAETSKDF